MKGTENRSMFLKSRDDQVQIEISPESARSNGGNFTLAIYDFDIDGSDGPNFCKTCLSQPPEKLFPGNRQTDTINVDRVFQLAVIESYQGFYFDEPLEVRVEIRGDLVERIDEDVANIRILRLQTNINSFEDITHELKLNYDEGHFYITGLAQDIRR